MPDPTVAEARAKAAKELKDENADYNYFALAAVLRQLLDALDREEEWTRRLEEAVAEYARVENTTVFNEPSFRSRRLEQERVALQVLALGQEALKRRGDG